jgi:hypothetical protein
MFRRQCGYGNSTFQVKREIMPALPPEPEPEYSDEDEETEVIVRRKPIRNRLPGERLLKQLYKERMAAVQTTVDDDDDDDDEIMRRDILDAIAKK